MDYSFYSKLMFSAQRAEVRDSRRDEIRRGPATGIRFCLLLLCRAGTVRAATFYLGPC